MPTRDELTKQYLALIHALQSGVAMQMNIDPTSTTPKHLRVGIDSAHVAQDALIRLLIEKGVITDGEYMQALVEASQREVARVQAELRTQVGREVTLG